MIGAFLTLLGCLAVGAFTQRWWRSYLNPVTLGVLAWTPALVMLNWPQFFVSARYIHLNRPLSFGVFLAMAIAFLSFWAGCALVKTLSARHAFEINPDRVRIKVDPKRLFAFFALGLIIFVYSYMASGLSGFAEMSALEVAESRVSFHMGPISFLIIFMDIAAIGFFALFLQTGRWIYALPLIVGTLAYGATFQKSPIVWLITAALFVSALNPQAVYRLLLRPLTGRVALVVAGIGTIVGLAATNTARGISAEMHTLASSPFIEQLYIYSGATAIKNMSVTIEGYLPSDDPTFGAQMFRPLLWNFVDRDLFAFGRYLEGINQGTYLNSAWVDFRWAGFAISPFVTGILVMLFIRAALAGNLLGLILGAMAARAVVFSIGTDYIFETITWYTIVLALIADRLTRINGPAKSNQRRGGPSHLTPRGYGAPAGGSQRSPVARQSVARTPSR
jgi:hypothetical protein